jgi:hypothetical protein
VYHLTEAELRCEAALEALVRHLKTFTLFQGTRHATFDARLQTKPSERREKPAFRRRKEENGQTQPQLDGTPYFSVRIALTGQPASLDDAARHSEAVRLGVFVQKHVAKGKSQLQTKGFGV